MALPIPLRKSTDCTYYLQGSCKKGDGECEFRHNPLALNPGVKDCAFWFNGRCAKGAACPFRHLAQNYGAYGMPRAPSVDPSTIPCLFYAQGKCNKGDACPYSHSVTLAAQAGGVNAVDSTGVDDAEEGGVPVDAGANVAVDAGRRNFTWRAQPQVSSEVAPSQENMEIQFDEEDEDVDVAATGTDRRRSTPSKHRRAPPLWDLQSTVARAGVSARVASRVESGHRSRPEPANRQIVREGRGGQLDQRGVRRQLGDRDEETGHAGGVRRVVARASPNTSVKDRLGAGASQPNEGSRLRVQARVNTEDSERDRRVVEIQRNLLAKRADRFARNPGQGETTASAPQSRTPEKAVGGAENGDQKPRFGAEARRKWLELRKDKEPGDGGKGPGREPSGERPQMRSLVELGGAGGNGASERGPKVTSDRGPKRGPESGAEKKEGLRILTLEEIRAAKKRAREAEEADRAGEKDASAREGKRPAPVRLNRAGVVPAAREEANPGEATGERAQEGTREELVAATEGGDTVREDEGPREANEGANGKGEGDADMEPDAQEGVEEEEEREGDENEEYDDDEGDEEEEDDGEDDIASLMKKYRNEAED